MVGPDYSMTTGTEVGRRGESATFDKPLQRVGPEITKADTNWRESLEPGLKLAGTPRYLATGDKLKLKTHQKHWVY